MDEEYEKRISKELDSINERTFSYIKEYCLQEQPLGGFYEAFVLPSEDLGTSTTACVVRIKYGRLVHLQGLFIIIILL